MPNTVSGSDALFRALIGATVDGVVVIDAVGNIQVFNDACERLFGYAADEVVGQNVRTLMPEPYRGEHDGYLSHYQTTGERKIIGIGREVVGQRKDKSTFPMYLSVGEGIIDDKILFVGIIRDLTALNTEIAQRQSADRLLAQIVQSSDDAIIGKTLEGVITAWNAAAERIFGYLASEAVGRHISILIPPDRLAEEETIISQLSHGRSIDRFETLRRHKDGRDIVVSISVSPIRDAEGRIFGASKTVRDISKQKEAEAKLQTLQQELAHTARISSMGQLSSSLAHELNQPLAAISNYIGAASRTLNLPGEDSRLSAKEMIERAGAQALRAGAIIRNLRDFVGKRDAQRQFATIDDVIQEAIALAVLGSMGIGARMKLDLATDLQPVLIDRVQIQQVLINLIRNAVEAMDAVSDRELQISTRLEEGGVRVTVCDTGPGLAPEVLASLFQPFVTTKEQGMGIGLTICKSIVEAHGGRMFVDSRPGDGVCMGFSLPLEEEAAS